MKKFITLISALVFTVALSLTAFAATKGWNQFDKGWKYSKNGEDFVTCEFAKSGDDFFYLGEDEWMLVNQVVEDNDNIYFVDVTGRMTKNAWVFVAIDKDADEHWMYFGANGKAVKSGWKEIGGKKYHFTDSKMDYGFLAEDGIMIDEEQENAYKDAMYFCGAEEDGHMFKNEWVKVYDSENEVVWLFFSANGKKVTGKKIINGVEYFFNSDGKMMTSFVASPSQASPSSIAKYFDENGACVKKGWIWAMDEAEEDYHWYYAKNNGELIKNEVKKINNKWYMFDEFGVMLTGIQEVDEGWMYFAENDDPALQGWASTGKSTIQAEDWDYAMIVNFNSQGVASNGIADVKGYLYVNGILIKNYNDEWDYKYMKAGNYIINRSGKIQTEAQIKKIKEEDIGILW